VAFRLGFSFVIVHLFNEVSAGNHSIAYLYIFILTLLWYLSQLFKHLSLLSTCLLGERIKSGLAMLLYTKVTKLTAYTLNSSKFGKINNLIANNLTVIEQKTSVILNATSAPFMLLGITIILYVRIGWPSLIGMLFIVIMIPIIRKIS
jgi:hypothetical protein